MLVRALVSFSGVKTMHKGQEAECGDKTVLRDLLDAGYVEAVESNPKLQEALKNEGQRNRRKKPGGIPPP